MSYAMYEALHSTAGFRLLRPGPNRDFAPRPNPAGERPATLARLAVPRYPRGPRQLRRGFARKGPLETLSDNELVARYLSSKDTQDGAASVGELFRRHYPKVVAWCLRFTGDRDEACDVAQAVIAKAFRHLASFRGESRVSTWLYAITRSECMNHLKARRSQPAALDADDLEEAAGAGDSNPELELEREGSAELVRALLDHALDETEKRVFTLHFGDDVPLDAITRLLGLSNRSGAKTFITSARRKLARTVRLWRARDDAFEARLRGPA